MKGCAQCKTQVRCIVGANLWSKVLKEARVAIKTKNSKTYGEALTAYRKHVKGA